MPRRTNAVASDIKRQAQVFAALGDPTRLRLVSKLVDGEPHSISSLTTGSKITRQAITKHLTVLESVGLVSKAKDGREKMYELDPRPLKTMEEYLAVISAKWDGALNNLKKFVEEDV